MDQYGIGQAINGAVQIYLDLSRQTGRTTSLIESLKSGDRVVFTNSMEAIRVERICREKGVEIETMVVDPKQPRRIFDRAPVRGDGRCIFDHSWVEMYYLNAIEMAQREIDNLQRDTSGYGTPHIETKIKDRNINRGLK